MSTSFLDLPREIRDQIYNNVLISPTGFVQPKLIAHPVKSSKSKSPPSTTNPRFSLCINPHLYDDVLRKEQATRESRALDLNRIEARQYTSLSLVRTCRQIYNETHHIFWQSNTFFFSSYLLSDSSGDILRALKGMGQVASRLITSITLEISIARNEKTLAKVLQGLASRARFGAFRKLELIFGYNASEHLLGFFLDDSRLWGFMDYDDLLEALRQGSEAPHYERVIRLKQSPEQKGGVRSQLTYEEFRARCESFALELHVAFGGKLYWNDVLAWENFKPSSTLDVGPEELVP